MRSAFRLVLSPLAAIVGLATPGAGAQPVDIAQAIEQSRSAAGPVRSARLEADAKSLQAEALEHLHRPSVAVGGFAGRVATSINLDTSQLAAVANPVVGAFDAATGFQVPSLPSLITRERTFDLRSLSLSGVVPLYTGGRLDALHDVALGRATEAQADRQEAEDRNISTVAQRYFSVQLAREAWQVRRAAAAGVKEHLDAAMKLERSGLIARAERLKADVAYGEAQREFTKSASDLEIAQLALARLLEQPQLPPLATPLFVHSAPPGSLQSFVDAAMRGNAAWRRIEGKRQQADASRRAIGSEYGPVVLGVGSYNLNRSHDLLVEPTWFVGAMVRVPLLSPIDKRASLEAARLEQERVDIASRQAERDIPTLVESQWRGMENARAQVLAMAPQLELARENLRLQQVSFSHQQSTALDVIDARLNLAKVQVQRSQSAYEYVLALARLLEACGQSERLPELARGADVVIVSGQE